MKLYRLVTFGTASLILLSAILLSTSVSQAQSASWWEWYCMTFPEAEQCQPHDYAADVCEEPDPADQVCIDEDGDGEDDNASPTREPDDDIINTIIGSR
ncbi:MAG: hypothetical protein AAFR67_05120 [Chloroflexota bacterium]